MKKAASVLLSIVLLAGFAFPTIGVALAAPAQVANSVAAGVTYPVLVGMENMAFGIEVNAFFPSALRIHVGDSVEWKVNTMEIHTVTFLAGTPLFQFIVPAPSGQPSPLMLNPMAAFPTIPSGGMYDGSTFVNSGVIGTKPGQFPTFKLTFTKPGTYSYVCIVHGLAMQGTITVEDSSVVIPSVGEVMNQVQLDMAHQRVRFPAAVQLAQNAEQRPTPNPDGSYKFHVMVGFSVDNMDIHSFFPSQIHVAPGDQVEFALSAEDMAPHTATFLNGTPAPEDFLVVPQPAGPPLLLINPQVLFPANAGTPLTDQGYFNSGFMVPGSPHTSFTYTVGQYTGLLPFECLLHDEMGMDGNLHVTPRPMLPQGMAAPMLAPNGIPLLFMPMIQD